MSAKHYVTPALLLLLALLPVVSSAGEESPKAWIERMNQAQSNLDFEGTFIFARGQTMHTLHITHYHDESGEWEEFKPLNGPERSFVRYKGAIWCLDQPDKPRRVSAGKKRNEALSLNGDKLKQIEQFYRIFLDAEDRVAGRTTRLLVIEPRDNYRFPRMLWLDKETALPLRVETRDLKGNAIERLVFTRFQLMDGPISQPVPLEQLDDAEGEMETVANIETPSWHFELPPGFKLLKAMRLADGRGEHYIFSDGLSSLSVFAEQSDEPEQRQTSLGAINSYIEHKYGHRFTVLGEVPVATIEYVVNSISTDKESAQ